LASRLEAFASDIPQGLHSDGRRGELDFWWLGQAGFLIRFGSKRIVIDPYLSDSLAKKYSGTRFPHQRMMRVPVEPQNLFPIDYVFITHGHTDHMDPESLGPIATANPNCTFVVPEAEKAKAIDRGVPTRRLASIDASDRMRLDAGLSLIAIPAAHEDLNRDAQGRHFFLGYVLRVEKGPVLYHSGDCIPYAGLNDHLSGLDIDLALLPINGRDSARLANGVPGNFSLKEAVELCDAANIPLMLGHHFGMFAENNADLEEARRTLTDLPHAARVALSELNTRYRLSIG
jgi:L-ascorbate metabolism protein UlaG (beta-lactamase superfamily)